MEDVRHSLAFIRGLVAFNMPRVADLGRWPAHIDVERSLMGRVPSLERDISAVPGFDAGIACCLDIIPRDRQRLAATLHAAYSEEAVEQVRRETAGFMSPDSESCWWLAASAFCEEDGVDTVGFLDQVAAATEMLSDTDARHGFAIDQLNRMKSGFELSPDEGIRIAWAVRDGGMQGAYLAGHDFAVEFAAKHGIWFIGTFRPSLGLEDFEFSSEKDADGRAKSGSVNGSRQYVKCATREELEGALAIVKRHLAR